jgi:thiol-disulfide isomerase/thioredoxin
MRTVSTTKFAAVLAAALVFGAATSQAFEEKAYDPESFKAAQSAGKSILVDVFAPWCPTCAAQQTVLGALKSNPAYDKLLVMKVDYDNDAAALKNFNARQQSTLIAFKGDKETGRSVGDTQAASIEALINTALK